MKTITIEDIYIELEPIFDENESGYNRRLLAYKKLNELLPKWEGVERQQKPEASEQPDSKALHIADVICRCPNCKSTKIKDISERRNNGILGHGYKSWIVSDVRECQECGIKFKPVRGNCI